MMVLFKNTKIWAVVSHMFHTPSAAHAPLVMPLPTMETPLNLCSNRLCRFLKHYSNLQAVFSGADRDTQPTGRGATFCTTFNNCKNCHLFLN